MFRLYRALVILLTVTSSVSQSEDGTVHLVSLQNTTLHHVLFFDLLTGNHNREEQGVDAVEVALLAVFY